MHSIKHPSLSFYLGLIVVVLGFISLRMPPVDSFWSMTLAPLLLVLGYLVLLPLGLWPRCSEPNHESTAGEDVSTSRFAGLGVFALALITYCLTLWPGPRWWDSAGYIASSITMGVDSAPGSLLLQLIGRLFSVLTFITSPAVRLNVMIALATAAAVTVVYFTIVRMLRAVSVKEAPDQTAIVAGSLLASLTLAFAVSVWSHAIFTNPYGLSLLCAAVLFYLAVRWWEDPDAESAGNLLLLAVFVLGLDVSVHRSNILFIPGFLVVVLLRRPRLLTSGRLWLGGVLLFMLGLSLQSFNMFRAQLDPWINMSDPDTLAGLWDYLALKQSGVAAFGTDLLQRNGPVWSTQIKHEYLRYLGWNFVGFDHATLGVKWNGMYGLPLVVGLVGMVCHFFRDYRQALRVLAMFLSVSVVAIIYLNVPENYFRKMDRHFMASYMIFTVWIGYGCYTVIRYLPRLFGERALVVWLVSLLLVIALPLNALFANWKINDQSGNYTPLEFGRNLLKTCEPGAILITGGDSDTFPLWYLQLVEGYRTDVTCLNYSLMNTEWHLRTRLKFEPDIPWSLTEESLLDLNVRAVDSHTVTIYTTGRDSLPVEFIVAPTFNDQFLLVADQVFLDIIQTNRWRRPVYISVGMTGRIPLGLDQFLRLDGFAYRLVPDSAKRTNYTALKHNVFEEFSYRGLGGEALLDQVSQDMTNSYRPALLTLNRYLVEQGDSASVKKLDALMHSLWPGE
ncbi:MAG: DUF2723 domain-containing protein [candidate division Zixibacteria bacterium]|nr:DUF2723 domain-containing protein [candidate division Zixibacteria bacterium]MDH3937811.1 DUF2723 domain-containing protein [candidate division Zixibacteria bacterium]MDH4033112.1 DUF2723 domain-containing protein [candidate division Zixibacteria bacterium]